MTKPFDEQGRDDHHYPSNTQEKKSTRHPKKVVDGIFYLDKPLGLSSNKALQQVKHLYTAKKAGHTGSLDPLATGLLPICLGEATKVCSYLLNADKTYLATIRLGQQTTTADTEGEVIIESKVDLSAIDPQAVAQSMMGPMQQTPPMYSALKHEGQPLYKLARKGIEIEREARDVMLYDFKVTDVDLPYISVSLTCSSGFYVRTLAEEFAKKLNTHGHLTMLRRTHISGVDGHKMMTIEELQALNEEQRESQLNTADSVLNHLNKIIIDELATDRLFKGLEISPPGLAAKGLIRLYNAEQFLGIGLIKQGRSIAAKRLINQNMVKQFSS